MRSPALLVCVLGFVACSFDRPSDVGDDAPGDGGGDLPDGPPPGTPLADRISVTTIPAPDGVMAGRFNWRIWGQGNLRISPVFTVPLADCGTLVGYTTGTTTPTARVARLDASDALVTTHDLGAFELRGLAAEPDGHWAALLWDATPEIPVLHVSRFDAGGAPGWSTPLEDTLAAPTDFGIGESRLEYGDGRYGAYFHVHGISGFAEGHEGDQLQWVDAATGAMSTGWQWGCSHSMSELLRFDPAANAFLSACVTDCFPGTSGDFAANSIGGVYLDRQRKVADVDAGCNGNVAGELGGLAPNGAGWALVWNAHQNPATPGQGSYDPATMNQDIAFATIAADQTPGAPVWLTSTPGIDEASSSIARWQPTGDDRELYLVGWSEGAAYRLAVVSADGAFVEGPIDATAAVRWGERDDPFRVHDGGDVVWSWFDDPGDTELHLARVRSGAVCR
jgi:hypothetical protein